MPKLQHQVTQEHINFMTASAEPSRQNDSPSLRKNQGPAIRVKAIEQRDLRTLSITWTDGRENLYDVVHLRRKCPCATCIDEWTHEPILQPEQVPDEVRPLKVESVGQYALTIQFSDGHKTGIYTFSMLRNLI
jgi:DUF971 family protein